MKNKPPSAHDFVSTLLEEIASTQSYRKGEKRQLEEHIKKFLAHLFSEGALYFPPEAMGRTGKEYALMTEEVNRAYGELEKAVHGVMGKIKIDVQTLEEHRTRHCGKENCEKQYVKPSF